MELFDYLMAKKGHNTSARGDLFSYLLGKKASGGSGTYTTFSGTSLNISNTIKAAIKKFMLNSTELTQDGKPTPDNPVDVNVIKGENNVKVENKNLFNLTAEDFNNGETLGAGKKIILTLKPNTNYTLSSNAPGGSSKTNIWFNGGSSATNGVFNGVSKTFSTDSNGNIYISIRTNQISNIFANYWIQLEEGSTATEYTEHQEQNYPITLSSKNLFNINGDVNTRYNGQTGNYNSVENNNLTTTYSTNNGYPYGQRIYVGTGKKVTISGVVSNINSTGSKSALIMCFNDNTTTGTQIVIFDNTEINTRKSFTFTADTDYIIVTFAGRYNGFVSATFTDIQVEYGETATPYSPYIANPLEYCKIGDYADQFFKNTIDSEFYDSTLLENEWYLKKNINKVTFNGSENWGAAGTFSGFHAYYSTITNAIPVGQDASPLFKSDKFHYVNGTSQANEGGAYMVARNFLIFVTENTVSDLKTWLSNHNTIIYYILETPTYIHISETDYPILRSQLENLYNNAKSYNGQTNITQTNDDLPFNISVDVKVLDTNLNMSNSLNSSLLNESTTETQNIAQSEEQTNLDDTNETEESVEEYQEL